MGIGTQRRAGTIRRLLGVVLVIGMIGGALGLLLGGQALPPQPPPEVWGQVSRVFDGETIRALLSTGVVETVRYIAVDAPAPTPSDCFGPEATLYNRDLVINRTVWLEFDARERDEQGRLLAYVYLDPQGLTMVNAILLAQGLVRLERTSSENVRYGTLLADLEREARDAERGLWGACPNSSVPGPESGNQSPRAAFTFRPERPQPGEAVQFDASGSTDPDGRIVQYSWDFGDGTATQISEPTVTHAYTQEGVYTVTLTISDDQGAVGRTSAFVTVGEAVAPPTPPPPTEPPSSGAKPVVIEIIHYDAEGSDNENRNGEWVLLRGASGEVDLSGWTLSDELGDRGVSSHIFKFPDGFTLQAGRRVKVLSGCGTDTTTELYWCARTQIWDNGEDTAVLKDAEGDIVDRCRYGDPDGSERGKSEFNCETMEYN